MRGHGAQSVPLVTDAEGRLSIFYDWPAGVASGFELVLQAAVADGGAPFGVALSNGLRGVTP